LLRHTNIAKADWEDFSAYLGANKAKWLTEIQNNQDLDQKAQILTLKLKEYVDKFIPKRKLSSRSKS